ncbi:RNA-binding protein [Lottiidibacillus patelloidae]|uniref:RNA-binding protein n=1 Tax=Lottiidibacillus patelloidae TaxID=2670334 RepID=A0A263BY52_9BACI|nr:RNA-binding protein [Lottiidibacillus patelloidae]OZM58518.1 RNA-binding protein [Lottiidibacillus patelloidae]
MSIYEHYHKDEHDFVDQVLDWKNQVATQYAYKLTDFLDPREQKILSDLIGKNDEIKVSFWGGASFVERKRAIIYPSYYEVSTSDFMCTSFKVNYATKFVSIEHRNVLGSLMSLGVKREKFGDVIIEEETVQFVIDTQISDYVKVNLNKIGKASVKLIEVDSEELAKGQEQWHEVTATVSSLRLDAILSEVYKLSRQKIVPLIKSGATKVNWKVIEQPSYECKENDLLSVRGFGRAKILEINGKTKKEKWRMMVGIKK